MTDRQKFEVYFWSIAEGMKDCGVGFSAIAHRKTQLWDCWQAALASQQPADDGWIEWAGGECPVELKAMVEVRHRSEKWCNSRIVAAAGDWRHKSWCPDTDIIAYRAVKP